MRSQAVADCNANRIAGIAAPKSFAKRFRTTATARTHCLTFSQLIAVYRNYYGL
jgi:hypothetical protein